MNIIKHIVLIQKTIATFFAVCVFGVLSCTLVSFAYADETSVHNSTNVMSNGAGTSHASVKTIINGVVVEDTTLNQPGSIHTVHSIQSGTTTSTVVVNGQSIERSGDTNRDLELLIQKLKMLINYYVTLLNHTK